MTLVLRKSVGSYSAGTRVWEQNSGDYVLKDTNGDFIIIPPDMLVELRNKVDLVPATPRRDRISRIGRRKVWQLTQQGGNTNDGLDEPAQQS
jgi:hypothetical protein